MADILGRVRKVEVIEGRDITAVSRPILYAGLWWRRQKYLQLLIIKDVAVVDFNFLVDTRNPQQSTTINVKCSNKK